MLAPIVLAQTEAPPAAVADEPHWVAGPSIEELRDAYPHQAFRMGITGRAILSCVIAADGRMKDCEVIDESPKHYGFGAAALSLSSRFRLSTTTAGGKPTEGCRIRIPLRFGTP